MNDSTFDQLIERREMGSAEINLVAEALAKAQAEMEVAVFDSENPFFRSHYASLRAVIEASKPALAKHGLAILQTPTWAGETLSLRTVVLHSSGQWLDGGTMAAKIDDKKGSSAAQGAGSLITYLRRYARAAVCQIYADADEDGNEPEPQQQSTPRTPPQPRTADEKTRMKALNMLTAAPGQPAESLVRAFLVHKGWIKDGQSVVDWPLEHVPTSTAPLRALGAEIAAYEAAQKPKPTWRDFPLPYTIGQVAKGTPLGSVPQELLADLRESFAVTTSITTSAGVLEPRKPEDIERDKSFRAALDASKEAK